MSSYFALYKCLVISVLMMKFSPGIIRSWNGDGSDTKSLGVYSF